MKSYVIIKILNGYWKTIIVIRESLIFIWFHRAHEVVCLKQARESEIERFVRQMSSPLDRATAWR